MTCWIAGFYQAADKCLFSIAGARHCARLWGAVVEKQTRTLHCGAQLLVGKTDGKQTGPDHMAGMTSSLMSSGAVGGSVGSQSWSHTSRNIPQGSDIYNCEPFWGKEFYSAVVFK